MRVHVWVASWSETGVSGGPDDIQSWYVTLPQDASKLRRHHQSVIDKSFGLGRWVMRRDNPPEDVEWSLYLRGVPRRQYRVDRDCLTAVYGRPGVYYQTGKFLFLGET